MKKLFLSAALAASALTGAGSSAVAAQSGAQAPMPPRPHGNPMLHADTNRDGVVTRAEAIADADRRFAEMDANRDGKATTDEIATMREQRMARRMERRSAQAPTPGAPRGPGRWMDPNRDGTVSGAEFRDRATKMFDRVDANHDGRVDANELAAMRDLRRMRAPEGPPPPPPPSDR